MSEQQNCCQKWSGTEQGINWILNRISQVAFKWFWGTDEWRWLRRIGNEHFVANHLSLPHPTPWRLSWIIFKQVWQQFAPRSLVSRLKNFLFCFFAHLRKKTNQKCQPRCCQKTLCAHQLLLYFCLSILNLGSQTEKFLLREGSFGAVLHSNHENFSRERDCIGK